uniref:Uncharacterized protein n=1 Tax=Romanomermis culicivorax TaxID=13658 RepID=A0A915KXX2_ROMCU
MQASMKESCGNALAVGPIVVKLAKQNSLNAWFEVQTYMENTYTYLHYSNSNASETDILLV